MIRGSLDAAFNLDVQNTYMCEFIYLMEHKCKDFNQIVNKKLIWKRIFLQILKGPDMTDNSLFDSRVYMGGVCVERSLPLFFLTTSADTLP